MPSAPFRPLVAIIGATGTGKSDLAVDLACRFNGEIINGDAMQLYQGLPIITNKITAEEMKGVPHHLLGRIGLEEETWTVGKFVKNALEVIEDIRSRGKLPILVGGTHYYTQSLLFQDALASGSVQEKDRTSGKFAILNEPKEVIMEKLREVDPIMADRWHVNDRRKIQRSLEIYLETGKPASQVYSEQRLKKDLESKTTPSGENPAGNEQSLRYPTLVLWVHANKEVLSPRLDSRIVKMLDRGLLSEVETLTSFKQAYEARTGSAIDQSRGIWVSIGYKEFLDYQSALSADSEADVDLERLKTQAIEKTQAATRQYAKRQIRWIRIKFLNALFNAGQKKNVFLLDGSDLSKWEEVVLQPSRDITERFLSGTDLPEPSELSTLASEMLVPGKEYDLSQRPDLWQKRVCETCGTVSVTENDWHLHGRSRAHRRAVGVKKKQANAQERRAQDMNALHTDMIDILQTYQHTLEQDDTPK